MEKLDKEQIAEQYADMQMGKERDFTKFSLQWHNEYSKALDVLKVAENHYLKLIEGKDKDISRIQARRTEITEEATRLKSELQQAKELLGESQALLKNTYTAKKQLKFDLNNKIEEFLNK